RFTYEQFSFAYFLLEKYFKKNSIAKPDFLESLDGFLQFLYELNVLSYVEETNDETWVRWCFRERSYSNIAPKVKTHLRYEIHYGLSKALNVGKPLVRK
ncbi:MAG: funZ protein, partial [Deltaproteobacteria bacterium]|nr:funZ protein [Deltaproteobacteria bacterium]